MKGRTKNRIISLTSLLLIFAILYVCFSQMINSFWAVAVLMIVSKVVQLLFFNTSPDEALKTMKEWMSEPKEK